MTILQSFVGVRRVSVVAALLAVVGAVPAASDAADDPLAVIEPIVASLNDAGTPPRVEDFLAALPREWLSNFTFAYRSRSRQGASRTAPRAFAFAADASIILTFNGDAAQAGYDAVETAIVRGDGRLEFRDIKFCDGSTDAGCRAALSAANPGSCRNCHGSSPHYIWQPYKAWPGFYGSRDDVLSDGDGDEAADFRRLRATFGDHARYGRLSFAADAGGAAPYRADQEPGLFVDQRANLQLTMALLRQHARVLAGKLARATSSRARERVQLVRYLAACPELGDEDSPAFYQGLRALTDTIGVPLAEHWSLRHRLDEADDRQTVNFSDGLMRLQAVVLSYLLPQLPEYAALTAGKGLGYADLYELAGSGWESPSIRTLAILRTLDAGGPMHPALGFFNAYRSYLGAAPAARVLTREVVCAVETP